MTIAIVVVPATYASEIGAHLADRYVLAYEEGDVMMLVNGLDMDSWTTGVLVQIDVPNISIIYASREYLESAASQQTFRRLSSLLE